MFGKPTECEEYRMYNERLAHPYYLRIILIQNLKLFASDIAVVARSHGLKMQA